MNNTTKLLLARSNFLSYVTRVLNSRFIYPMAALGFLLLINAIISPDFFTLTIKDGQLYGSMIDVLNRSAPVALLVIGMSLVIATGGIDLSVGAIMAIAGAVCANLITHGVDNIAVIIFLGMFVGLIAGAINGSLISFLGIQPIVATLVLMVAGRGVAQLINHGQIITFQHADFAFIGVGSFLFLPFPIVLVAFVLLVVQLLMRKTALGLFTESVGCNAKASYYLGINVSAVKMHAYCITGICAALAGMVATADIQGADANNTGLWLELDAILAVVIGGASLMGGRFSLPLSILGVLIIQTLSTTILMSGIEPKYNLLIKAVVIIFVLLLQSKKFQLQLKALFSLIYRNNMPKITEVCE